MVRKNNIEKLSKEEKEEKLKELKFELLKAKVIANKSGKTKLKEIKKAIARLMLKE